MRDNSEMGCQMAMEDISMSNLFTRACGPMVGCTAKDHSKTKVTYNSIRYVPRLPKTKPGAESGKTAKVAWLLMTPNVVLSMDLLTLGYSQTRRG